MKSDRLPVVILSAGMSTRMGFPKLLLAQDDEPLIIKMIERLCRWGDVAILLSDESLIRFVKNTLPQVQVILNPFPERGMISSIRLGIDWVCLPDPPLAPPYFAGGEGNLPDGLLVWQVDHPLVSERTLDQIRQEAVPEKVVIPTYNGRRGHPTWWGRDLFDELRSSVADGGAREVLRLRDVLVKELPVQDEAVLFNIDTPEDAERSGLTRMEKSYSQQMKQI